MQRLFQLFSKLANWPTLILLLVAIVVCNLGFIWRSTKLGPISNLPDAQFWYSRATVNEFLNCIQQEGRDLFALTELTLDILYPMVYVAALIVLIIRLYPEPMARRLLIFPLLGGGFDLIENFQLAYLALTFDNTESAVATTSALCTSAKFVFLAASGLAVVVGVAGRIWGRRTRT